MARVQNISSWLNWWKLFAHCKKKKKKEGGRKKKLYWVGLVLYLQHSQCVEGKPGGLCATTRRKEAKHNPDIVYPVSDVKATYCRVQCLTLNLLLQPLKCVHFSVSWHYLSPSCALSLSLSLALARSLSSKPQQLILQQDRPCFHVGAPFSPALMIENTSGAGGGERKRVLGAQIHREAPAPAPAQTTLQGIRAHPGSRMVSLKNFSNHF